MRPSRIAAALLAATAIGAAQADSTLFSEGFDNFYGLADQGWSFWNLGPNPFDGWQQGDGVTLTAPDGPFYSYARANYLVSWTGPISVWMVTPEIQLTGNDTLHFYVDAISEFPWIDNLRVLVAAGSATSPTEFASTSFDLKNAPPIWLPVQLDLPGNMSSVRIAFEYYGSFTTSNYLGIDSISVTSAVPEPATALLMGLGLAGIAQLRRRRMAA